MMRVYKFINQEYGLLALGDGRIKISTFDELNDPFEFAHINLQDRKLRQKFSAWRKKQSKKTGVISFCGSHKNPLMWAHYANNPQGFCLEFEIQKSQLLEIKYIRKRPTEKIELQNFDETSMKPEFSKDLITAKFREWEYEQERRLLVDLKDCEPENGLYFQKFSDQFKLKRIFLGANFSPQKEEGIKKLAHQMKIKIIKKRAAFGTFEDVTQQNWP